jgi:cell cycle checkpoint control protein RAD9A
VGSKFFTKYHFTPVLGGGRAGDKFTCRIHNKALVSIFKGRALDPSKEKGTAIEKCEVSVEDGEGKARSRFIVKLVCKNGS